MRTDELSDDDRAALIARLGRVEGQVRALQTAIETGDDCRKVLTQFTAASKALRSAGAALAVTAFESCVVRGEEDVDADALRKVLLALT